MFFIRLHSWRNSWPCVTLCLLLDVQGLGKARFDFYVNHCGKDFVNNNRCYMWLADIV